MQWQVLISCLWHHNMCKICNILDKQRVIKILARCNNMSSTRSITCIEKIKLSWTEILSILKVKLMKKCWCHSLNQTLYNIKAARCKSTINSPYCTLHNLISSRNLWYWPAFAWQKNVLFFYCILWHGAPRCRECLFMQVFWDRGLIYRWPLIRDLGVDTWYDCNVYHLSHHCHHIHTKTMQWNH